MKKTINGEQYHLSENLNSEQEAIYVHIINCREQYGKMRYCLSQLEFLLTGVREKTLNCVFIILQNKLF